MILRDYEPHEAPQPVRIWFLGKQLEIDLRRESSKVVLDAKTPSDSAQWSFMFDEPESRADWQTVLESSLRDIGWDLAVAPERNEAVGFPPSLPRRVGTVVEVIALLLPDRIASEDLGDALEVINYLVETKAPPWKIYLKVVSTICWLSVNAIREVTSAFLGKAKASAK